MRIDWNKNLYGDVPSTLRVWTWRVGMAAVLVMVIVGLIIGRPTMLLVALVPLADWPRLSPVWKRALVGRWLSARLMVPPSEP